MASQPKLGVSVLRVSPAADGDDVTNNPVEFGRSTNGGEHDDDFLSLVLRLRCSFSRRLSARGSAATDAEGMATAAAGVTPVADADGLQLRSSTSPSGHQWESRLSFVGVDDDGQPEMEPLSVPATCDCCAINDIRMRRAVAAVRSTAPQWSTGNDVRSAIRVDVDGWYCDLIDDDDDDDDDEEVQRDWTLLASTTDVFATDGIATVTPF
jgi:hypothetical protein